MMVVNEAFVQQKKNKGTKARGIQYILYRKCTVHVRLFNKNHTVT